jgi:hypothetical protein
MMDLSTKILKNGIKNLLEDEDVAFKKSLSDCLSFKLNEAINEVKLNLKEKLFVNEEVTKESEELKYFIEFVTKYDPKINNKIKLKNQSYVSLTESEFNDLVSLFDGLSPSNRQIMLENILNTPHQLKSNIIFYKNYKK